MGEALRGKSILVPVDLREMVRMTDACIYLGCSRKLVRKKIRSGVLRAFRYGSGLYIYRPDLVNYKVELDEYRQRRRN